MSDLKDIIGEKNLVSVSYNQDYLGNVLREVLSIFKQHSNRISILESEKSNYVTKDLLETLQEQISQVKEDVNSGFMDTRLKLDEYDKVIEDKFNSFKEWSEDCHLQVLSDTKRMISDELESVSLNCGSGEEKSSLEAKISIIDKRLSKLISELRGKVDIDLDMGQDTELEPSDRRIDEIESNIAVIQKQIADLPSMSYDLKNLVLQFPAVTKRIEKKINDVIYTVEGITPVVQTVDSEGKNSMQDVHRFELEKLDDTPGIVRSQTMFNNVNDTSTDAESTHMHKLPSPEKLSHRDVNINNEESNGNLRGDMSVEEQEEGKTDLMKSSSVFADDFEPIQLTRPNKIDLLDDLLPELPPPSLSQSIPGQSIFVSSSRVNENGEQTGTVSPSVSYNSNYSGSEATPFHISAHSTGDPNQPIVHVVENHTYKTEIKSSERIVSEIEWLKNMITTHHEAIRKAQQNIRAQQDNIDSVVDSVNKTNMNINTKINHAGQQAISNKNDIDSIRHKLQGGINTLNNRIIQIVATKDPSVQSEPLYDKNKAVRVKRMSFEPIDINGEPRNLASPLTANVEETSKGEGFEDPVSSSLGNADKTLSTPGRKGIHIDKPALFVSPRSKVKKLILVTNSFFVNTEQMNERIMTSYVRDIGAESKCVSKVTVGDISPSLQLQAPIQVKTSEQQQLMINGIDESTIDRVENVSRKMVILEGGAQRINKMNKPKENVEQNVNVVISQEMIEEKVSRAAKTVISDLTQSVYEKVQLQVDQMRKGVNAAISTVDQKIDREFVERLFSKFRVMLNEMNEKVDNMQCSFLDWITRDELEMVLQKFLTMINESDQGTAATNSKFNCLLCGRPRAHLSGMIEGSSAQNLPPSQAPNQPTAAKSVVRSSVRTATVPRRAMKRELESRGDKPPRDIVQLLAAN